MGWWGFGADGQDDREKSVIRWLAGLIGKFQSPDRRLPFQVLLPTLLASGAKLLLMRNAEVTHYKFFPLLTLTRSGLRPPETDLL